MRKCLMTLWLALSLVFTTVFAAGTDTKAVLLKSVSCTSLMTDDVSVEAEIKNASEKNILVAVVKRDSKMEDAIEDKSILAYTNYITASADTVEFTFNMAGKPAGYYNCILTAGSDGYDEKEFYYTDGESFKTAWEGLDEDLSADALKTFLGNYVSNFDGLDSFEPYKAVCGEENFYKLLNTLLGDFDKTEYSTETFCGKVKTAAVLTAFNLSKSGAVKDGTELYYDELGFKDLTGKFDAYSLYSNELSVYGMKNAVSSLYGRNFKDNEECYEKFCESVFVQYITNNKKGGTGHIKTFLESGYYDLDLTNYNSSSSTRSAVNASLISSKVAESITTVAELQEVLDKKVSGGNGGNSSTNGGSSSGGKGSSSVSISPEYAQQQKEEGEANAVKAAFSDMAGYDWATDAVNELCKLGIVSGNGDNRFEPYRAVTRAEFVKLLLASAKAEISDDGEAFYDAEKTHWAYDYIVTARKLGIAEGSGNNIFGVDEEITREDCAVMINRLLKLEKAEAENVFADDESIADYAKEAVYTLSGNKIIYGTDENKFEPKRNCGRAEAAVMLYRLYGIIGG